MSEAKPSCRVLLFPEQIEMPPLATAHLRQVTPSDRELVARYELVPVDEQVYDERLRDLHVNAPSGAFSPLSGTWLKVLEPEDEEGHLFMCFGLHKGYGRALAAARAQKGRSTDSLVPGFQIRAMLYGLLGTVGV